MMCEASGSIPGALGRVVGAGKSLAFWLFFLPYAAAQTLGAWVTLALCGAAALVGLCVERPDNRVWMAIRPFFIAVAVSGFGATLILMPLDRSLRDFEQWYRRGAGLLPGMTQDEAERTLSERCTFTVEPEGALLTYRLKPSGMARLHPLRGFASLELYVVHVRMDPVTTLLIESSILGE